MPGSWNHFGATKGDGAGTQRDYGATFACPDNGLRPNQICIDDAIVRDPDRLIFLRSLATEVTDDNWVPEYAGNVHKLVEKHGGKCLSRSENITTLEGLEKDSAQIATLQFPSTETLENSANDPGCTPYAEARRGGSVSSSCMIDDTVIAGAIPYLPIG